MDQATIQEIAQAVAREVYAPHWTAVALGFIFAAVVSGAGAYLGAYLKRKGENFATKEDFDSLRAQLQSNTRVVEEIKSEFGQRDWAAREWATIRREKLEELLKICLSSKDAISEFGTLWHLEEKREYDLHVGKALALVDLYFPELERSLGEHENALRGACLYLMEYRTRFFGLPVDVHRMREAEIQERIAQRQALIDECRRNWIEPYGRVVLSYRVLALDAGALMRQIAGVGEAAASPDEARAS